MRGLGPHLPGSLVLTPHLVVVVVSRGGVAARVATRSALDAGASTWTIQRQRDKEIECHNAGLC